MAHPAATPHTPKRWLHLVLALTIALPQFMTGPAQDAYADDASDPLLALTISASGNDIRDRTQPGHEPPEEDHILVQWSTDVLMPATSVFHLKRDDDLLRIGTRDESEFADFSAEPDVVYTYCIEIVHADASAPVPTPECDTGRRAIAAPSSFRASDGDFEAHVALAWTDNSNIEGGFNVYRSAGHALSLNGTTHYLLTPGVTDLSGSYTFEFWANRASTGAPHFVVNLEASANGDPVNVHVEAGFNAGNQFEFRFGTNVLATPVAYNESNVWHHWAVVYDAPNRRRLIFRDGELLVMDVVPAGVTPVGSLEFGRRAGSGSQANRGHFAGRLDEIRFWRAALTPAQIRSLKGRLLRVEEPGLDGYWPMDVQSGVIAPDVVGARTATIVSTNNAAPPTPWVVSGIGHLFRQLGSDPARYMDNTAVSGYQTYEYQVAAFEDVDQDGVFTPGTDFESDRKTDAGWRALLAPPIDVSASDGQFSDRVRITWSHGSASRTGYRIYRREGNGPAQLLGTVAADATQFEDKTGADQIVYSYCVAAIVTGAESKQVCDDGRRGGLLAPSNLEATRGKFDDRVQLTWSHDSDTEDGFELFRSESPLNGVPDLAPYLLKKLDQNTQAYSDFTALADVEYHYCIRAFSEADPISPAYSQLVCTEPDSTGFRLAVLSPTGMNATDNEHEDKVVLKWKDESKTAMLLTVYRDAVLIDVLPAGMTTLEDKKIPSDQVIQYCVGAVTVKTTVSPSLQNEAAQVLQTIRYEDGIRLAEGGAVTPPAAKITAVYSVLGVDESSTAAGPDANEPVESVLACDDGSRSLEPPTDVAATDNEFERHVQLSWTDNSAVNLGYLIFRDGVRIDSLLGGDLQEKKDFTAIPGTVHNYSVRAFDAYGRSAAGANPGSRILLKPGPLVFDKTPSEKEIRFTWTDNSAAEKGYEIQRRTGNDNSTLVVLASTASNNTAYVDTAVSPAQSYTYFVRAFDDFGQSDVSEGTGSTILNPPTSVNARSYVDSVVVVWVDRSEAEDSMLVTRTTLPAGPQKIIRLDRNTTRYVDVDVTANTDYKYCVRAKFGGSALSDENCSAGSLLQAGSGSGGGGGGGGTPVAGVPRVVGDGLTSNSDGAVRFGMDVAIADDGTTLVGAPGADPRGVVVPFVLSASNEFSVPGASLLPDPNAGFDEFGHAVSVHGNYAAVGDPSQAGDGEGAYTVWKRTAGSWSRIVSKASSTNSNLGVSVANADSFVVVGDDAARSGRGAALVCNVELNPTCDSPVWLDSIITTMSATARFGLSVDIARATRSTSDSLYVIVGAEGARKAFIFECDLKGADKCSKRSEWAMVAELSNTFNPASSSRWAEAVAIDTLLAVVGAPGAKGIVAYQRTGNQKWDEGDTHRRTSGDAFGSSVDVRGLRVAAGDPLEAPEGWVETGAVYTYSYTPSGSNRLGTPVRYDARVHAPNALWNSALFGTSVAIGPVSFLVGAPRDGFEGKVYSIPFGFEPPDDPILPSNISLNAPTGARASDGTAPDRIQIRWKDQADNEDGHIIYRSVSGGSLEELAEVAANIEFYDDFSAEPGEAYTYCVAAFALSSEGVVESDEDARACDVGWRPPNGAISGRIATRDGSGSDEVRICLVPDPNKSLLFDGTAGFVEIQIRRDAEKNTPLNLQRNFTIEAWIRPQTTEGTRAIISRDSAYTLAIKDGDVLFTVFESTGERDFLAGVSLVAGAWRHVAAVREDDNDVTFYLDGIPVKREESVNAAAAEGDSVMTIGRLGAGSGFFSGEIDEVRIWNVALDSVQVRTMMSSALIGNESELIGYWPLDQGKRLVAPDISSSANHGRLVGGVYLTDRGADVNVCATSDEEGNYSIARIRYGQAAEFDVTPFRSDRVFSPTFKKISLDRDSPVANEVFFSDVTAFTVKGEIVYEEAENGDTLFSCPVPDVTILVERNSVPVESNARQKTKADGSFSLSLNPTDPKNRSDVWWIKPVFSNPEDASVRHVFSPADDSVRLLADTSGIRFFDTTRHTLTGHLSGGDPGTCGMNIGKAIVKIYTEDGCFVRYETIDSGVNNGAFSLDLPPQRYLIAVDSVFDAPDALQEDVREFFAAMGAVAVDLSLGDVERNLIYRAPLELIIEGLEPSCPAIAVKDEEGGLLRTLPGVFIIPEFGFQALNIRVRENYGLDENNQEQSCAVGEGTVTIFDAISDRVDLDSTRTLQNGLVEYTVFGASPNPFSGARIGGVDRSYQKPITVAANVEGRPPLTETAWAVVEGHRERPSTFVSAVTEAIPFHILHDPPGGNSYAFMEKGTAKCTRIMNMGEAGFGVGFMADVVIGLKTDLGFSFGAHSAVELGGGVFIDSKTTTGVDGQFQTGSNYEVCVTAADAWSTSSDPGWVGEDIFVGAALNFIFALADKVESAGQCELNVKEVLATDLNAAKPFETTYSYGKSHIELSLIPELQNLVRLAGDAAITGQINSEEQTIRLNQSIDNWRKHLKMAQTLTDDGLKQKKENRSFSGGTEFSQVRSSDSTWVTSYEGVRFFFKTENAIGAHVSAGYDQKIGALIDFHFEHKYEKEQTQGESKSVGFVLSDNDAGDFMSVDVGTDPTYGTPVFKTVSGRTSNPCEANTQCRDNPLISVDPPVIFNVDPDDAAPFQVTLINASESNERRRYHVMAPPEANAANLSITMAGTWIGAAPIEYVLDPGKALTVNMDVFASPPTLDYERIGVMIFAPDEYPIWQGDARLPFARSDTAFFSVHFNSSGGNVQASMISSGWNWVSINRDGGPIQTLFQDVPLRHGDVIRGQREEARYDSSAGWTGTLKELRPGRGYRLRMQEPSVLRVQGPVVEVNGPLALAPGWSWIGYLPAKRMSLDEAVASLSNRVIEGDAIVAQDGFAQYIKGVGWVGTLTDMTPGESYAIYLDGGGELSYPEPPETPTPRAPVAREITVDGPAWVVRPEDFDGSMTVVAEIRMDGIPLRQTTTNLAVFAGEQIRGIGEVHFVETLDQYLAFIQIYGGMEEETSLVVHAYDGELNALYEEVATISYSAQRRLGSPASPVGIELSDAGQAPELNDLPTSFAVRPNFPNPFSDYTIINYDLPEPSVVRMVVYDLLGRRVATLVDGEVGAGSQKVVFDGRGMASGVYLYRMLINGAKYDGKMVLVR